VRYGLALDTVQSFSLFVGGFWRAFIVPRTAAAFFLDFYSPPSPARTMNPTSVYLAVTVFFSGAVLQKIPDKEVPLLYAFCVIDPDRRSSL